MMEEEEEGDKDITCTPLLVRVPLGCLRRRPSLSLGPMVSSRPLGMFTDKGVQAERGMIVDKEVRGACGPPSWVVCGQFCVSSCVITVLWWCQLTFQWYMVDIYPLLLYISLSPFLTRSLPPTLPPSPPFSLPPSRPPSHPPILPPSLPPLSPPPPSLPPHSRCLMPT